MNRDSVFDLPELLDVLASHLPQGALYRCFRVSKSWNVIFLPHLWRTFSEETTQYDSWGQKLTSAIQMQLYYPQQLEWYKDVYRHHAKYICHLTILTPAMLDVCYGDVFEPLRSPLPLPSQSLPSDNNSPGKRAGTGAESGSWVVPAGRPLITNLESLTVNISQQAVHNYFLTPIGCSTSAFSASAFGTRNNNNSDATTGSPVITTTAAAPPPDREKLFVTACQRLIHDSLRLYSLSCTYSEEILQAFQSSLQQAEDDGGSTALKSLKHLSYTTYYTLAPGLTPPNVTSLQLKRGSVHPRNLNATLVPETVIHERLDSLEVYCVHSLAHFNELMTQAPYLKTLLINRFISIFGPASPFAEAFPATDISIWQPSRVTVLKCQQARVPLPTRLILTVS